MIVPGMLVGNIFLISVCMFIVSKTFLIIKCYSDCSRSIIWLKLFATVLLNMLVSSL